MLLFVLLVLCVPAFFRGGGQATNPGQVAQMLQGLSAAERGQMAAAMGVSPQQLAQVKTNAYSGCTFTVAYSG